MGMEEVPRAEQLDSLYANRDKLIEVLSQTIHKIGVMEVEMAELRRFQLDTVKQLENCNRVEKGGFSVEERKAAKARRKAREREEEIGREEVDLGKYRNEDMQRMPPAIPNQLPDSDGV